MDTAPHASALFDEIHALIDPGRASPLVLGDRSESALPMSWDSFNPVQAFFDVYWFNVDRPVEQGALPTLGITTLADSYDEESDVRSVSIRVDHVRFACRRPTVSTPADRSSYERRASSGQSWPSTPRSSAGLLTPWCPRAAGGTISRA